MKSNILTLFDIKFQALKKVITKTTDHKKEPLIKILLLVNLFFLISLHYLKKKKIGHKTL